MPCRDQQSGIANVSVQQPIDAAAWARPAINKERVRSAAARSMACCGS